MRQLVPVRVIVRALVALAIALVAFAPGASLRVLAADTTVHIGDTLDPAELRVTPGSTVTWVNDSGNRHRVRSTSGPTEFDSGDLDPGQSFSVTFPGEGTWQYRDDRNRDLSNYWGTVTVAAAPTPAPAATPTPRPGATPAPATPAPVPPPGDILMAGRVFSPRTVTIDVGTTVRWRNNDGREHTVTANDRSFDSGMMNVGATFVKTFVQPGTYGYICAIHPDMTGTVAVRSASGGTPPPATPAPRPTPPPSAPPGGGSGTGDIRVVDFAYSPASMSVVAGTTVTWVNDGAALHTVTASDGSWDSGLVLAGGTFTRRFGTPGTYLYLCGLHPSMTGVVRVSGPNGATPPPPASATQKPTAPPTRAGELELRDFAFVPSSIRIAPGTTVTWLNTGAAPHTVTDRAGAFDSGTIARGARWTHTFPTAGTFRLICAIHPEMSATLTVAAPGATAPPPVTPAQVATPAPGSNAVVITDFDYAPQVIHVPVGTTIRWLNRGVAPHTVTAKDRSFDSGFLSTNDAYTRTFTAAGTIDYLCAIHPAMVGTVVVGGSGGGGTAAGPSAEPGSASPSAAPSSGVTAPGVVAGGVAGGGAQGAGSGSGPTAGEGAGAGGGQGGREAAIIAVDVPLGPVSTESLLRLGLVALLALGAIAVFVWIISGLFRRTAAA